MQKWKTLSLSAQLLVDAESGARGIVRDTRACGLRRFHWCVIPAGEFQPIAAGHTRELARARSIAEIALRTYAEDWLALSSAVIAGADVVVEDLL